MKKQIFLTVLLLFLSFASRAQLVEDPVIVYDVHDFPESGLSSVSIGELVYSTNPNIDSFVKTRLDDIHAMTRTEWLMLDGPELKQACYRAFTPAQKLAFWNHKLDEVCCLEWSPDEMEHINRLKGFLNSNPGIFSGNFPRSQRELAKTERFLAKWRGQGKENFGWSENVLDSIMSNAE